MRWSEGLELKVWRRGDVSEGCGTSGGDEGEE